jgi:hypothetical protein
VSSQVGIDNNSALTIGEYVKRGDKAWTQGNANPYSDSVELCGFAGWTPAEWDQHPHMLEACGRWLREEAAHFGIPLVRLNASQAQGGARGVCGHNELGAAGGGHWDPGPSFPWARVLAIAKGESSPEAEPLVLGALPFIATREESGMPPEYILNDVANGSRKFGVYPSGLVRRLFGWEFQYVRDKYDVHVVEFTNKDDGEQVFQLDQALRGQVKERK